GAAATRCLTILAHSSNSRARRTTGWKNSRRSEEGLNFCSRKIRREKFSTRFKSSATDLFKRWFPARQTRAGDTSISASGLIRSGLRVNRRETNYCCVKRSANGFAAYLRIRHHWQSLLQALL